MSKKTKIIALIILILFVIVTTLGTIFYPITQIKDDLILSKFEFSNTNDECPIRPKDYCLPRDRKYKIVPLESNWKNPLNPVFSIVYAYNEGVGSDNKEFKFSNVLVIKLSRKSIFDFQYSFDRVVGHNSTINLSFEQVIEYTKARDIFTDNPDSINIRNIPPLTQEQIESNKKLSERDQAIEKFRNEQIEKINNTPKDELYKDCLDQLNQFLIRYEEALKQGATEIDGLIPNIKISIRSQTPEEVRNDVNLGLEECKSYLK